MAGLLNVHGCSMIVANKKETGKDDNEFGSVSGKSSGVDRRGAREGMALLVSSEVQQSVIKWNVGMCPHH